MFGAKKKRFHAVYNLGVSCVVMLGQGGQGGTSPGLEQDET